MSPCHNLIHTWSVPVNAGVFARRAANRVVFMDDGQIVEHAAPEQFFTAPTSPRAKDFLGKILTH
jgi:glutamate transport system ATP-binding protein